MFNFVEQKLIEGNGIKSTRPYQTFRNRFEHTKRVYGWAKRIIDDLPNVNHEVLLTSAIFHDVGYSCGKDNHAEESAKIFLEYALDQGFDQDFINQVYYCILNHSHKRFLWDDSSTPELILLLEADLLDEEGAMAISWDLMTVGEMMPTDFKEGYDMLMKYSIRILSQDMMVTPKAKAYWEEKKDLVRKFLSAIKYDLFIDENIVEE
jgi:uncharacterized protein